ncbi:flagellar basal-body MS-ring/collar protein FliF [Agromyces humi]|uniref:flagellar basal-body MS-ring/collar protein FliF n=1 Tax=Agromyces humi TaxID=1766800 RepID=UPI00135C13DF|nr:flagellar basal-body MS-ring/collar protein FliF [Agromyces humi]
MPRQITSMFGRLKSTVGGFTTAQKALAVIGVAVVTLGIVAFATFATKPTLTPLFTGLAGEDASAIVEQLQADGVQYELADGGATIMVPQDVVYEQRLKAASEGLPASETGGYALLDKMGVTSSEFQQSVTYKRALEGELEKTISAMDGVQAARVQIAIPEETVFAKQKEDPTASVFIRTKAGITLTSDQVNSIAHLTSASIEGMDVAGVSVIDSSGAVLSTQADGSGAADKVAADFEDRTRASVQQMLDRIVGPGNSTVAVAATVSKDTSQVTSETFTATDDVPPLSESTETEEYTGGAGNATGVLGPDNIAVPNGEQDAGTYNSEKTVRNNSVNKETEVRNVPAGQVARQTVSVAVNEESLDGVTRATLEAIVAAAAGIDEDRGDEVAVELVQFNGDAAQEAQDALSDADEAERNEQLSDIIRTSIIAAAVAIIAVLGMILLFRRGRSRREPLDPAELDLFPAPEPAPVAVEEPILDELDIPQAPPQVDIARASLARLATSDPQKMAAHLRAIMEDTK